MVRISCIKKGSKFLGCIPNDTLGPMLLEIRVLEDGRHKSLSIEVLEEHVKATCQAAWRLNEFFNTEFIDFWIDPEAVEFAIELVTGQRLFVGLDRVEWQPYAPKATS